MIRIQSNDFDLSTEIAALRANNLKIGAIASFVGVVRDFSENRAVSQLELEHYPGMTEKILEKIVRQAKDRWKFIDARIIHRTGSLEPGDQIVLVAVAATHRKEALAACEFIMDYLKTQAPFWKKEKTGKGYVWVNAREADQKAMEKWENNHWAEEEK